MLVDTYGEVGLELLEEEEEDGDTLALLLQPVRRAEEVLQVREHDRHELLASAWPNKHKVIMSRSGG